MKRSNVEQSFLFFKGCTKKKHCQYTFVVKECVPIIIKNKIINQNVSFFFIRFVILYVTLYFN